MSTEHTHIQESLVLLTTKNPKHTHNTFLFSYNTIKMITSQLFLEPWHEIVTVMITMIMQGINLLPPKQLLISFCDNRYFFSILVYRTIVLVLFVSIVWWWSDHRLISCLLLSSLLYVYNSLQVQSLQTLLILWVPLPNVKKINFFALNLWSFFFLCVVV